MKKLKNYFYIYTCMIAVMVVLTGCPDKPVEPNWKWKQSSLCQKLVGTSWKLDSTVYYWYDGRIADTKKPVGFTYYVYTFTDIDTGNWWIYDFESDYECYEFRKSEYYTHNSSLYYVYRDYWCLNGNTLYNNWLGGEIVSLTDNVLQLKVNSSSGKYDYYIEYYKKDKLD